MSRSPLLEGLPPIGSPDARLVILGNMPSVLSLASGQYYGNPRNAFWRIIGELFDCDADAPYQQRTATLDRHGIAVWDVLKGCRRIGSLDSAIEPDSMVPNDFARFFATHSNADLVLFNGAAAERNFTRLVHLELPATTLRLPSTSPAQTMRYADKLGAWSAALTGAR
ncbi:hypoxanthine-DNA glycosylase [Mycolicibacterium sp. BK556]|uniref:DNA-deoxyinosine glycosylase n=1 Tax=unclassified Mycolicibacterium TaxID=2636767 RepID=UPI00161E0ED8|nr:MULTISPECIES: DNA-deoxyinosine glycosylase [unclassified Mycolicibacterium]MBB3605848.1 hypoxanthine-DNA glycosylase [Mycolicibacterium sp. BK556]MBB3635655.1 hypoxanthine-DNA glycosylase [Mycolicibacterium sp. BK607]MBB3753072.1 hypoxanthine-DNA glycosylase [Mycolicibacterium sp. BK634]